VLTNNFALAHVIASIGSLNGYGSSIAQTQKALDTGNTKYLKQENEDVNIFKDIVAGIAAAKEYGFNVEGMIAINKAFTHSEVEDPIIPGHLRNALYNSDDNIAITVDEHSQKAYIPPEVVSKDYLQGIVDDFENSDQSRFEAWKVFARLSKLQPFQDGNKRTALIAANSAMNVWRNEDYLVLPFNDLDKAEFSINLMRFYDASDSKAELAALKKMVALVPSQNELVYHQTQATEKGSLDLSKVKTKPLFRKPKDGKQ
jgi:hypothetical protein